MGLGTLLLNADQAAEQLRGNGRALRPADRSRKQSNAHAGAPLSVRKAATPPPISKTSEATTESSIISPVPSEELREALFVILWPALGCPALVDPIERSLEIILVCKEEKQNVNVEFIRRLIRQINVVEWNRIREPYARDQVEWNPMGNPLESLLRNDGISIHEVMELSRYRDLAKERHIKLGGLSHTVADVVPRAYLIKGFKAIVSVRLTLEDPVLLAGWDKMYALYYPPENGLLRQILDESSPRFKITEYAIENMRSHGVPESVLGLLETIKDREFLGEDNFIGALKETIGGDFTDEFKTAILDSADSWILKTPYDDIPLMNNNERNTVGGPDQAFRNRSGTKERQHLVRLFHPFYIVHPAKREYLNVGHITDAHTSTLWDYFDHRIFPDFDQNGRIDFEDIKKRSAASNFSKIASSYNNPNLNLRNLTQILNSRTREKHVDLILQTGDLIDFNRGFNHNENHDPDRDYVFNLNWIRFYELLLLDYEKPTFMSLGNHDLHLNPYPPLIDPEFMHELWLIVIGMGAGAAAGAVWGALEKNGANDLVQWLLFSVVFLLVAIVLLLIVVAGGLGFDFTIDFLIKAFAEYPLLTTGMLTGGSLLVGLALVIFLELSNLLENLIFGFESEAGWGAVAGGVFSSLLAFVGIKLFLKHFAYMNHSTNLRQEDFPKLLQNAKYLHAFNKDGVWYSTDLAFDWYALVISPFTAYAFHHGNMSFMIGSWEGSSIFPSDPPMADDAFTGRQWGMINDWLDSIIERRRNVDKEKDIIPIIGLHTPIFCPKLNVNLDDLNQNGMAADDGDLKRGTMEEKRDEFIKLLFKLGQGQDSRLSMPIPVISLTGHSHVYDIMRMDTADKVKWHQIEHSPWKGTNTGLHITTASAGPPSDGMPGKIDPQSVEIFKEELERLEAKLDNTYETGRAIGADPGQRARRPAGCRVLTFDLTSGKLEKIEEISSTTSKWGEA